MRRSGRLSTFVGRRHRQAAPHRGYAAVSLVGHPPAASPQQLRRSNRLFLGPQTRELPNRQPILSRDPSAEREGERFHARIEKLDLELSIWIGPDCRIS